MTAVGGVVRVLKCEHIVVEGTAVSSSIVENTVCSDGVVVDAVWCVESTTSRKCRQCLFDNVKHKTPL